MDMVSYVPFRVCNKSMPLLVEIMIHKTEAFGSGTILWLYFSVMTIDVTQDLLLVVLIYTTSCIVSELQPFGIKNFDLGHSVVST